MGTDGLPGPTDAWITLAGLARDTTTIRLGTLMTSATFRLPRPARDQVAEVDAMSDGRVELGIGAGWFDDEHTAYGIPFPDTKERFDRLEEQLAIVTGLWATPVGETYDFDGTHYQLDRLPGAAEAGRRPGRRSSSAARARSGRPRWRPSTPTSSTSRSSTRRSPRRSSPGCAPPARRSDRDPDALT